MAEGSLKSRKVVVLGGSSGIGFAVAQAAQGAGASVVIGSSTAAKVDAAVQRLGGGAVGAVVDVTDEASVAKFFAGLGQIDHLAYTAGDWAANPGASGPPAAWDVASAGAVFSVRFWGAVTAVKYAAPLVTAGGSITLTDGVLAHRPRKGGSLSTAMLGAIEHLTQALAVELAPIRVNAVCAGLVLTEALANISAEQLARMASRQPIPRAGDPAELAEAYLYLMRGGFTTGQVLVVDGGRTLT